MGKEVINYGSTVNDGTGDPLHVAFAKLDAGARLFNVIDRDLTAPPGSPAIGDCYIVGASATGVWATHDGKIAVFGLASTWRFITLVEGLFVYIRDEDILIRYTGSAWTEFRAVTTVEFSFFKQGVMSNNELLFRHKAKKAFTLPAAISGSDASAEVAATASTVVTVRKNGTSVGTATWAISGTVATLAMASPTDFAVDDVLTITGPATADATLADVSMTLVGTL